MTTSPTSSDTATESREGGVWWWPLAAAGVVLLLAQMGHDARHGLRPWLAVDAGLAAVVTWSWVARYLTVRSRVWATAVMVAGGAAGTWQAVTGVTAVSAVVTFAAAVVLAVPWWQPSLLGAPDDEDEPIPAAAPARSGEDPIRVWDEYVAGGHKPVLPRSRLVAVERIPAGWTGTIELSRGEHTAEDAVKASRRIASAYKLNIMCVSIEQTHENDATAKITVAPGNPLRSGKPFEGPSFDPATGQFTFGVYGDGSPARVEIFKYGSNPGSGSACHGTVAGDTGTGKSGALNLLLAEAWLSGVATIWAADMKGGQSIPQWLPHIDWAVTDIEGARMMLRAATAVMQARQRHLTSVVWEDADGRRITGRDDFPLSPDFPLLLLLLEEAPVIYADEECTDLMRSLAKQARSLGISIWQTAQHPTADELGGTAIRNQLGGNAVIYKAGRSAGTLLIEGLPQPPTTIPKLGGLGYIQDVDSRVAMMRTLHVVKPYEWIDAGESTPLDALSAQAAGRPYEMRGARHQLTHEAVPDPTRPFEDDRVVRSVIRPDEGQDETPVYGYDVPSSSAGDGTDRDDAAHTAGEDATGEDEPAPSSDDGRQPVGGWSMSPDGRLVLGDGLDADDVVYAVLVSRYDTNDPAAAVRTGTIEEAVGVLDQQRYRYSRRTITSALGSLVEAGRVEKVGHGQYRPAGAEGEDRAEG